MEHGEKDLDLESEKELIIVQVEKELRWMLGIEIIETAENASTETERELRENHGLTIEKDHVAEKETIEDHQMRSITMKGKDINEKREIG